jgi:hypothetical protein
LGSAQALKGFPRHLSLRGHQRPRAAATKQTVETKTADLSFLPKQGKDKCPRELLCLEWRPRQPMPDSWPENFTILRTPLACAAATKAHCVSSKIRQGLQNPRERRRLRKAF